MTKKRPFWGVKSGSKRAEKLENQTKRSKNERNVHFRSLQMNDLFSMFISVQYKRTFRSLHSFPFYRKERFVLYVHFRSIEKNGNERTVLLGFISRKKHEKRTEKNVSF